MLLCLNSTLVLQAQSLEKDTIKMQGITISATGKAETIHWLKIGLVEAANRAEREQKKILVYFTAKWCGPCHKMEDEVFTNYQVIRVVNDNYIALKIDVDAWGGKKWVTDFGVRGMPEFFILDANRQRLRRNLGAIPLDKFLEFLNLKELPSSPAMLDTSHVVLRPEKWKNKISLGLGAGVSRLNLIRNFGYEVRLGYGFEKKRFGINPALSYASLGSFNYIRIPVQFSLNFYKGSLFGLPGGYRVITAPYYGRLLNNPMLIANKNDVGLEYGLGAYIGDLSDTTLEFSIRGSEGFSDVLPEFGKQMHQFFRAAVTLSLRKY